MNRSEDPHASAATGLQVCAYPRAWRLVAAVLFFESRAILVLLAAVLVTADVPITLSMLLRALAVFALLPALAAGLIGRAFAARVEVGSDAVVMLRGDLRVEIPNASVARVAPWVVPLPAPGVALGLRSGRRLPYGLAAPDPSMLVTALGEAGGIAVARLASGHPSLVYARAREQVMRRRWYHVLGKFVAFALLPALVFFNAHQHIAYGGPLGEYHLLGLASYLKTFGVYWATVMIYLLLYAAVLRGFAEAPALAAAWLAPAWALAARRAAEIACRLLYFGGVPVAVLLRFLA